VNVTASNEVIGKAAYRRNLIASQSGRCLAGYVYSSCGPTESSTDVVFGGHAIIAENGNVLAEAKRFGRDSELIVTDLDLQRLGNDHMTAVGKIAVIGERIPIELVLLFLRHGRQHRAVEPDLAKIFHSLSSVLCFHSPWTNSLGAFRQGRKISFRRSQCRKAEAALDKASSDNIEEMEQ
jgi:hypothetical protein